MHAEPTKEHKWLEKLVGEWTSEMEAKIEGQAPEKSKGSETVRSLGGPSAKDKARCRAAELQSPS